MLIVVPVAFCGYDAYKSSTAAGCQQGIADAKYTKDNFQTGTYQSDCTCHAHASRMISE